jgi:hypothetical protein
MPGAATEAVTDDGAALVRVLVVGDSISGHYMEFLPIHLGSLVASCTGGADWSEMKGCSSNRMHAFMRCSELLTAENIDRPDIVLFNCGLHDIMTARAGHPDRPEGDQAVPPDAYRTNLEQIVALVRDSGAQPVWATTTPIYANSDGVVSRTGGYEGANFDRSNTTIDQYNAVASAVMAKHGVPIVDLHGFTSTFTGVHHMNGTYDSGAPSCAAVCAAEQ